MLTWPGLQPLNKFAGFVLTWDLTELSQCSVHGCSALHVLFLCSLTPVCACLQRAHSPCSVHIHCILCTAYSDVWTFTLHPCCSVHAHTAYPALCTLMLCTHAHSLCSVHKLAALCRCAHSPCSVHILAALCMLTQAPSLLSAHILAALCMLALGTHARSPHSLHILALCTLTPLCACSLQICPDTHVLLLFSPFFLFILIAPQAKVEQQYLPMVKPELSRGSSPGGAVFLACGVRPPPRSDKGHQMLRRCTGRS